MKRRLAVIGAIVIAAAIAVGASGGGGAADERPTYEAVFDQAFGVVTGVDVRAAGVRVGQVKELDVERGSNRALVTLELERTDFGAFRDDVFCRIQPQSLIGEYFVNCDPGTSRRKLAPGARIPVEQTATTIQPDLVQNILRRPWRERFGLILTELGAGFGARGEDLSATIRRAVPALRETDRVLAILADNRQTLRELARDADQVLTRLATDREDVSRFVSEARDTAAASASRRTELAATVRNFPGFLRELRPTLAELSTVARRQTPALRGVRASATSLTTLFQRLGPFATAAGPAIESLGEAAQTGTRAADVSRDDIAELRKLARSAEEPARNLRFVLEHLDNRDFAAEPNAESPGGKGFTGLEALLQYPFMQSQAINTFDTRGYLLKLNALVNECTAYTNGATARSNPERTKRCTAMLGDGGPVSGADGNPQRSERRGRGGDRRGRGERPDGPREGRPGNGLPELSDLPPGPRSGGPSRPDGPGLLPELPLPDVPDTPELPVPLPDTPAPGVPPVGVPERGLADYLLGP